MLSLLNRLIAVSPEVKEDSCLSDRDKGFDPNSRIPAPQTDLSTLARDVDDKKRKLQHQK